MDRPPTQHHPSGRPCGTQRTVIPKNQVHDDIKIKSQSVDSTIVLKSSGVSSEEERENNEKRKVPSVLPFSSQAYEKYLTEMEFKIRYMKNDIEYKQEQIRKRAKTDTTSSINSQVPYQPRRDLLKGGRNLVHSSLRKDSKSLHNISHVHSLQSVGHEKHPKRIPHTILHQSSKIRARLQSNSTETVPMNKKSSHLTDDSQSAQTSSGLVSSSSSSAPVHPEVLSALLPANSSGLSLFVPPTSRFVISPALPQSGNVFSSVHDRSRVVLSSAPFNSRVVLSSPPSHSKITSFQASSVIVSTSVPVSPRVVSSSVHVNSRIVSPSTSAQDHSHVVSYGPVKCTVASSLTSVNAREDSTSAPVNSKQVSTSAPINSRQVYTSAPFNSRQIPTYAPFNSRQASTSATISSRQTYMPAPINPRQISTSTSVNSRQISTPAPINSRQTFPSASINSRQTSTSVTINSRQATTPVTINSRQATTPATFNSRQTSTSAPINSRQANTSAPTNSGQISKSAPIQPRLASISAPVNARKASTFSSANIKAVSSSVPAQSSVSVEKPSHSKAISAQSSVQNLTSRLFAPNLTSPTNNSLRNKRQVVVLWKRGHQNEYGLDSDCQKPETSRSDITTNNPTPGYSTQTSHSGLSSRHACVLSISRAQKCSSRYKYLALTSVEHTSKGFSSPSSQSRASSGCVTSLKSPTFHAYHSHSVPVTSVTQVSNMNRQTLCETKSVKKITPLKVKTAAKLVSKYKWKRPSPTSVLKMAPCFCTPSRSLAGYKKTEKILSDHSFSKYRKVNVFKIDKRKLMSKSCSFPMHPSNKSLSSENNGLMSISSSEKKCFSLKSTRQQSVKMYSKRKSITGTSGASVFPADANSRNKHHWASVDMRTKDLKKALNAKRYATLSRFRWKSSKPNISVQPVTVDASRFKWLQTQASRNKNKLTQQHLQKHFLSGSSKTVTRMPFALHHLHKSTKLVMIGGVVYRSSPRSLKRAVQIKRKDGKLLHHNLVHSKRKPNLLGNVKPQNVKLIHVRGIRYHSDARGKKLCRALGSGTKKGIPTKSSFAGVSLKSTKLNVEKSKDVNKKAAASRALHRSLAYVAAKHKKDNRLKKGKQRYCMFFCRFGKCHRGNDCPYIHDPNKVVVCTRFLRGKCDVKNCRFSHDASVHKMPVCLYYLQGLCSREDCMYLHVNVSPDAPPCKDFIQGFCSLGKKCKKLHSFLCPSFAVFGKCTKGDKCALLHRHSKKSSVAFPLKNPKSQSDHLMIDEKVEDQGTIESLPLSSSQNESAGDSSLLAVKESDCSMEAGKLSPLKSQPAFISLSSLKSSNALKVKGLEPNVEEPFRESKPKIKPEFLQLMNMSETVMSSHGNGSTVNAPRESVPVNSQEIVSNKETAIKVQNSGFINLTSSLDSDFTRVESSDASLKDGSPKSYYKLQISPEKNLGHCQEIQSSLKTAAYKTVLFKGIIPNFLPSSLPIKKAPGSE